MADRPEYHYAVRCPDGTVGEPMRHLSDAEGEAADADRTHDGSVCTEPHTVVQRANVWLPAAPAREPGDGRPWLLTWALGVGAERYATEEAAMQQVEALRARAEAEGLFLKVELDHDGDPHFRLVSDPSGEPTDALRPCARRYEQAVCGQPGCSEGLEIRYVCTRPVYLGDTAADLADVAAAYGQWWSVECYAGHVVLLPIDHGGDSDHVFGVCPCGGEDDDCEHAPTGDMARLRAVVGAGAILP